MCCILSLPQETVSLITCMNFSFIHSHGLDHDTLAALIRSEIQGTLKTVNPHGLLK